MRSRSDFYQAFPIASLPPECARLVKPGADHKYHVDRSSQLGHAAAAATPHFGGRVLVLMNAAAFSTTCEYPARLHAHGGRLRSLGRRDGRRLYYCNTSARSRSCATSLEAWCFAAGADGGATHGDRRYAAGRARAFGRITPWMTSTKDVISGRDKAMEIALRY